MQRSRPDRILVWMCVLIAVDQLSFGGIVPVLALYARSFGVSQSAIGVASGRMQLIATIDDPPGTQRILAHLGLPGVRDGPPLPAAVSAAPAEQPALPSVTL
jgi:hypothetical protein